MAQGVNRPARMTSSRLAVPEQATLAVHGHGLAGEPCLRLVQLLPQSVGQPPQVLRARNGLLERQDGLNGGQGLLDL